MLFRIADTFTDSLARLTGDEQKAVKTTAFDLQMDPSNPGLSFHKLDSAKDKNFWSVRVSRDLRLIVHKTQSSLLLCYVDHHDNAYAWAERRKLETHPKTGAAQFVEIRETVQEIRVPVYVQAQTATTTRSQPQGILLFANTPDEQLLGFGVPKEWLHDVKQATEDSILALADHLPAEAAEALLELATGGSPRMAVSPVEIGSIAIKDHSARVDALAFAHPDAQRRFRTIETPEELARALEFPWDKWTIFLHPEQRLWVEKDQTGPTRVSGSAGTGKTIVALHRAAFLAKRYPNARVLLATYSEPLANALSTRLRRLISSEPRLGERIDVGSIPAVGQRLYRSLLGTLKLASREIVAQTVRESAAEVPPVKFSFPFLVSEWEDVVDAWQLIEWSSYRDVGRLGRKTRLKEDQRRALWSIFERVQSKLTVAGLSTEAGMFSKLASAIEKLDHPPYDLAVVDESQDISISQLKFFAALGGKRPNGLFFAGDLGQRIFQPPFSWIALGVDIRGRSRTLRVNYRTSHQIRTQADRLLDAEILDPDGNIEGRGETISVFNGAPPTIETFRKEDDEIKAVAAWLSQHMKESLALHEMAIFVRSEAQLPRALAAVQLANLQHRVLDERVETVSGFVSLGTMHVSKGLEFRAVAVMACDDEVIPLQSRIESVSEEADLKDAYDTERQLLYVACTRARDHLFVSGVEPVSEFLTDLKGR